MVYIKVYAYIRAVKVRVAWTLCICYYIIYDFEIGPISDLNYSGIIRDTV